MSGRDQQKIAVPMTLSNGLETRLLDSGGNKPALILVHGLANSLEIWQRVYPGLAEDFRVIAFDLPGFGQASRPDSAYDGPFFGAQIVSLMDRLEIEAANLVGYSMGASAILHFSKAHQHRIKRAVLAAPGGFGRRVHPLMLFPALPLIGKWLGRPTALNNQTTLRLAIYDASNVTKELVETTNAHAAIAGSEMSFHRALITGVGLLGARHMFETAELARNFQRKCLVLWGNQDRVFPAEYSKNAVALLPDARLKTFEACGHYPQWEQPQAFNHAVCAFLNENG